MKTQKSFSLIDRARSIKYAYQGIEAFFAKQHNAVIHLFFTVFVMMAAVFFDATGSEIISLVIVAGLVWAAEIFNTAIEAMMDHLSPEEHPKVKFIKDVSAAAVLVTALTAVIIGLIIFIPKLI